jgi:hypothetical protein
VTRPGSCASGRVISSAWRDRSPRSVSQSDALIRLRSELSRPAFEAALADVPFGSGEKPSDRMIGLFHIRWAYPADGGILFEVGGMGGGFFIGGGGFYWTDDESEVYYNYEPLGDQRYSWVDRW